MRTKSFYIGLGLMSVVFSSVHAMVFEEESQENNPNCQIISQKIKSAHEILENYKSRNGQIPLSETNRYEDYSRELLNLYNRAKGGEEINVKQELFFLSRKFF